jgi:hypothetical protein
MSSQAFIIHLAASISSISNIFHQGRMVNSLSRDTGLFRAFLRTSESVEFSLISYVQAFRFISGAFNLSQIL